MLKSTLKLIDNTHALQNICNVLDKFNYSEQIITPYKISIFFFSL